MPPPRRRAPVRPRAVLYGRQSETTEESISLELQESANREYAAKQGYDVVAVLTDPGISGKRWANRPGAVESIRMIEEREADVVVAWRWSRISRRRLDFEIALDRADRAGGCIESSTEPIDTTTASGRFHRGVLADVAQFESERIGEGWKETHASRRARGVLATGGDRYGYTRTRDEAGRTTGYEIDEGGPFGEHGSPRPSPAEALRLAYRWYIGGWGPDRIRRELNDRGYLNKLGRPFKTHGILPLLDSGFAAGLISYRAPRPDGSFRGEFTYTRGTHPPIIDDKTWQAYLATRASRASRPTRTLTPAHPLTGLLRCGDCGAAMVVYTSRRGPDGTLTATYVCNRWRAGGSEAARCVTVSRSRLERAVREWLAEHAADVEAEGEARRRLSNAHRSAATEAVKARERAQRAADELGRLTVMRASGEVSAVGYDSARVQLEAEHARAESAAQEAELAATREPEAATRSLAGRLSGGWEVIPTEDLNNGLRRLLTGVWVWPPQRRGHPSTVRVVPRWEDPPEVGPATPPEERPDAGGSATAGA